MPGIISIREGGLGPWEVAVESAPKAGIFALEINVRPFEELDKIVVAAKANGVRVLTLSGGVMLDDEAEIDAVIKMIEAGGKLDIPVYFISANGSKLERDIMMARLANLGEVGKANNVTLALETHPPFCQNADGMLLTMSEVNHPNVRLNLDTANVFYYNHGLDSADELERVMDFVASLHLKDTDGAYESMDFPVLGEGIVNFPRIKQILDAADFSGPLTMELEGPVVDGLELDARIAAVVRCMDHLRAVGIA